jgi:hypothetical protein
VCNKARVEGCIVEAFACKEIMNLSSKYLLRTNNVNARTMWYHIVEEVLLTELLISNGRVKVLGLLVHIMSRTTSGTIGTRTWSKSNHILTYLTRHIGNEVDNLH